MRRHFILAAASVAVALGAWHELALAGGHMGNAGGGGGHAGGAQISTGGGSFSRPAPVAPSHPSGGGNIGGRLPSVSTYSRPAPAPVHIEPARPSAPQAYPRTSVPTFVNPSRPAPQHVAPSAPIVRTPPTVTQPLRPPGEGFIRIPGNHIAPSNTPSIATRPGLTPSQNFVARPQPARSFARTAAGLGTMPAIQEHLQKRGQNLQTWSASRDQRFNQLHEQNAPHLQHFQRDRDVRWSDLRGQGAERVRLAREHGADWQNYRRDLGRFREDRAAEIRDHVRDGYDDLFTRDWWRHHHGRNFALTNSSPWWWWSASPWNSVVDFCGFGWNQPVYYDYDANVVAGNEVYIDGQDAGSGATYAEQAMELANPVAAVEEPAPPEATGVAEWQPLGVFALTQEEKGDAVMFFQLAVNKAGLISGAFTNTLTDDTAPVVGSVDRKTQRAAWHVGDKTTTVYEAGVANLTQGVAPVLIHFDAQSTQTWLLVRMPSPDLPNSASETEPPPK